MSTEQRDPDTIDHPAVRLEDFSPACQPSPGRGEVTANDKPEPQTNTGSRRILMADLSTLDSNLMFFFFAAVHIIIIFLMCPISDLHWGQS